MENKVHSGIGIMSGTSMDGLDLAHCEFSRQNDHEGWSYKIIKAHTYPYSSEWKQKLAGAYMASAEQYFALHAEYGRYIADRVSDFTKEVSKTPGFIASHGHTVFHRPAAGFSTQIGCGATIAAHTGLTTVCDFRSLDVANGGQGAPLVPVGDKLLFGNHSSCLNLGGIANISFDVDGERKAFDICIANMALNHLSQQLGKDFDESGNMARTGKVHHELLQQLNSMTEGLHRQSIGREFFENAFLPALDHSGISPEDRLATCVEHSAMQIGSVLMEQNLKDVLVTGGGAYNTYLLDCLKKHYMGKVTIPGGDTIQFKEALIFAFLGLLRLNGGVNTLDSVTGARTDSCGGAVYFAI